MLLICDCLQAGTNQSEVYPKGREHHQVPFCHGWWFHPVPPPAEGGHQLSTTPCPKILSLSAFTSLLPKMVCTATTRQEYNRGGSPVGSGQQAIRITVPPAAPPTSPWYLHSSTCRPHARWLGQLVLASRDALTIPMFCCVHVFGGCRPPNGERDRAVQGRQRLEKLLCTPCLPYWTHLCGVRRQTDCLPMLLV